MKSNTIMKSKATKNIIKEKATKNTMKSMIDKTMIVEAKTLKEGNIEVEAEVNTMIERAIETMKETMIDFMIIDTRKDKTEEEVEEEIMKIVIEIITIENMITKKSIMKNDKILTILIILKMQKTRKDLNKQEIMVVNSLTKDDKTEMKEVAIKETERKIVIILNATMKMTEIPKKVERKNTTLKINQNRNKNSLKKNLKKKRKLSNQITLMICLMWTAIKANNDDSQQEGIFQFINMICMVTLII